MNMSEFCYKTFLEILQIIMFIVKLNKLILISSNFLFTTIKKINYEK